MISLIQVVRQFCFIQFANNFHMLARSSLSSSFLSLGSLSTRVFETRTATGREHFACQGSGFSQIFKLILSNGEKILSNVNVVV